MYRKRFTAMMLGILFSLVSVFAVYGGEETAKTIQYAKVVEMPEDKIARPEEYIPVLMYHHFAIRNMGVGNGVVTTVQELEDQLRYFKDHGYRIISLEELDEILTMAEKRQRKGAGLELKQKYLCITMDDGYYSNYELGYPIFKKYKAPISVFAITDFVEQQIGIKKFTWKQAAEMEKSGFVRIYSHTADHQPLQDGKEDDFLASIEKSEEALQKHLQQGGVKAFAYPNGRYNEEVQQALREAGYDLQFTVEEGVINGYTAREAIPRIMVTSGMDGKEVIQKIEKIAEETFAAEEGRVEE